MNGGVCLAVEVDPARIEHRCGPATSTRSPDRSTRRSIGPTQARRRTPRHRASRWSATSPRCCRRSCRAASSRRRHRSDVGARSAARLRAGRPLARRSRRRARARRGGLRGARPRLDGGRTSRRCSRCKHGGVDRLRLRQQPARAGRRSSRAARARSRFPASCRRSSGRCSAAGPDRSAGSALSGDPGGHPRDRRGDAASCFPARTSVTRWIAKARERVKFQGLPARICWLEYGERAEAGLRFNWLVKTGTRRGADRHRPRPSRRRIGGLAEPRDRRRCRTARTRLPTGRC